METLVVDSHQHFWENPSRDTYPWMTDDLAAIRRTFGPDELRPQLAACGVNCTVVVQTRPSVEETRAFLALADRTEFVAGVVGWVDLTSPDAPDVLRDLRHGPGGNLLVGIRHQVHDEADPAWLLREDVFHGLEVVDEAGLAYDLLVRPRELPAAQEVARRLSHLRLVIDHIAKPPIRSNRMEEWATGMAPLADLGNVYCKLSGMVTEADWSGWTLRDLVPYVEQVVAWFGSERLMFGSDWPVCLLAASYQDVFEACRSALGSRTESERAAIFGGNAVRFYQLETVRVDSADTSAR